MPNVQFGWLVQIERKNRRVVTRRFFLDQAKAMAWLDECLERHPDTLSFYMDRVQTPHRVRHLSTDRND